jgi:hypothetical protein
LKLKPDPLDLIERKFIGVPVIELARAGAKDEFSTMALIGFRGGGMCCENNRLASFVPERSHSQSSPLSTKQLKFRQHGCLDVTIGRAQQSAPFLITRWKHTTCHHPETQ